MLIELIEGEFWVNPDLVAVVKKTGKKKCALFLVGQPAVDGGFALDYPADKIAKEVNASIEEPEEEPDEDPEDDNEQ